MGVVLLRLFLAVLFLTPLAAHHAAAAQTISEPQAVFVPVSYLPFIGNSDAVPTAVPDPFAERVVALTNVLRAEAGCPALQISPALTEAAMAHSQDMATNGFFDHIGSDGATSWERIIRYGYRPSASAENIAVGFASPDAVMLAWRNSSGHRQNLLNCSFTEIGVGYVFDASGKYQHYWTQDFGRP